MTEHQSGLAPAGAGRQSSSSCEAPETERAVLLGRRVASAPLPRQLRSLRSGTKKIAWTALEARRVRTPWRYAFRELVRPTFGEYALRDGDGRFCVRHRTGDVDIFRKFYGYGYYEWPVEVRAELSALGRPVNVLDLGANIGFFQVHARNQLPIGRVVGFEPDPSNADVLERVRDANGADWEIIRACASNSDGVVKFRSGHQNFSRIDDDGDRVVPKRDVFPYIAQADLVKMNIEGSEWEVLEDPRLANTSAIWIIEYHRIRNPEVDITALARRLLEGCGYLTRVAMSHQGNGLLWAWRSAPR